MSKQNKNWLVELYWKEKSEQVEKNTFKNHNNKQVETIKEEEMHYVPHPIRKF